MVLGDGNDRLHGFAQTHVIGKNPIQVHGAESLQPMNAVCLIIAEFGLDLFRRGCELKNFFSKHLFADVDKLICHRKLNRQSFKMARIDIRKAP